MRLKIQYVVMPIGVYTNQNLSATAKLLFPLISMLEDPEKGCYARNDFFAEALNKSLPSVTRAIKNLIDEGLVITEGPSNEKRKLRINPDAQSKLIRPPNQKRLGNNNILDYNISLSKDKESMISSKSKSRKYKFIRSKEIKQPKRSRLITYWNRKEGCQTHSKPDSKTYINAAKMLRQLKSGSFYKGKIFDKKWLEAHKDLVHKSWTDKELKLAIDSVALFHKDGYWPAEKSKIPRSLKDLIYNPISKKSLLISAYRKPPGLLSDQMRLPNEINPKVTDKLIAILYDGEVKDSNLSREDLSKTINAANEIINYHDWIDLEVCEKQPFLKRHFRNNDFDLVNRYIEFLTEERYVNYIIKPHMLGPKSYNWNEFLKYLSECLLPGGDENINIFKRDL